MLEGCEYRARSLLWMWLINDTAMMDFRTIHMIFSPQERGPESHVHAFPTWHSHLVAASVAVLYTIAAAMSEPAGPEGELTAAERSNLFRAAFQAMIQKKQAELCLILNFERFGKVWCQTGTKCVNGLRWTGVLFGSFGIQLL